MASITSPEQGAQQEWRGSLLCPSGNSSFSRIKGALGIPCALLFTWFWKFRLRIDRTLRLNLFFSHINKFGLPINKASEIRLFVFVFQVMKAMASTAFELRCFARSIA